MRPDDPVCISEAQQTGESKSETFETLAKILTTENMNSCHEFHDNLCFLIFESDTGQHSQFLQCFCTFP